MNENRFSTRAQDYARFRPGYPSELFDFIAQNVGIRAPQTLADIGSGTGIFTKYLLDLGHVVYAVEPNEKMRIAAELALSSNPNFKSIAGNASATNLPDQSVDHITVAQAFHWFDPEKARVEFKRILKPSGMVALVWNLRKADTPFLAGIEAILQRYSVDYKDVKVAGAESVTGLKIFFGDSGYQSFITVHSQLVDLEHVIGLLRSTSYSPEPGHINFDPMYKAVEELYNKCEKFGRVEIKYETQLLYGRLA